MDKALMVLEARNILRTEDFNKESFKMLAWHRFVLWQQIIQSEPKRIRDSGGVQSVLMDIVEQQQKEWDELKNKREIMEEVMKTREDLAKKIRFVLNCASREGCTDTPDFILAEYMLSALECFETACRDREKWYGRQGNGVMGIPITKEDSDGKL